MALTAALKAQIAAWYKALQEQIPDFIPRAPQRQMIADVAKTLAGKRDDTWRLKRRPAWGKLCPI
ncbi:ATP-dependent DNA helicase DinG [Kluyvera cryocrescens]|uniref:ATP-dependent DNA helicase DinG n=1 Tax=Kluyvera cryocrescens TaxID=580 RepID=A0A485ATY7_KLUCR|nr:ATP-dependent DNA helicase DinG [Kluyvera cryocrescens]